MRKMHFLLMVGLLTVPALGDAVDVAGNLNLQYTGVWTQQDSNSSTWAGGFEMSVVSSVYEDTDGNLAFVYDLMPSTDGVFALNLAGDFSFAEQATGLHNGTGGDAGILYVNFVGDMSVVLVPTVDTDEHFIFSFLVLAENVGNWDLYSGNALGNGGATGGYAYAPGIVPLPEPGTLSLLGAGLLVGGCARFRKRLQ